MPHEEYNAPITLHLVFFTYSPFHMSESRSHQTLSSVSSQFATSCVSPHTLRAQAQSSRGCSSFMFFRSMHLLTSHTTCKQYTFTFLQSTPASESGDALHKRRAVHYIHQKEPVATQPQNNIARCLSQRGTHADLEKAVDAHYSIQRYETCLTTLQLYFTHQRFLVEINIHRFNTLRTLRPFLNSTNDNANTLDHRRPDAHATAMYQHRAR